MAEDKEQLMGKLKKMADKVEANKTPEETPNPVEGAHNAPRFEYPVLADLYSTLRMRIPKWEDIEVTSSDEKKEITITVKVKKGYEFRREKKNPLVYTLKFPMTVTLLTGGEVTIPWEIIQRYPVLNEGAYKEVVRDIIIKETADYVTSIYFMEYINPVYIFNPNLLSARVGGPDRAYTIIAHLAKEGSPLHASLLVGYAKTMINRWSSETSPGIREMLLSGMYSWGFPAVADFLNNINPIDLPTRIKTIIINRMLYGIEETVKQYAPVYSSPDNMSDEDIKKTYETCDKVAKSTPIPFLVEPVEFDQTTILTMIESIITVYPQIKPIALAVIREYTLPAPTAPAVSTVPTPPSKEEIASEVAKEIVEGLKEKKLLKKRAPEEETIDEIKKRILERMKEL